MTLGDGNTVTMYALSHVHGAGDSPVATRGFTGNTTIKPFIPSKPGDGLRAFADDTTIIPAPVAWIPAPVTIISVAWIPLLNVKLKVV